MQWESKERHQRQDKQNNHFVDHLYFLIKMMVPSPFFLKLKTGYSNTKVSLGVNWSNIDTKQISFPFSKSMPLSVLLRSCCFLIILFSHNEDDNIY
jgi:hypothetical protein